MVKALNNLRSEGVIEMTGRTGGARYRLKVQEQSA
jgi:hypothetical protein